MLNKTAYLKRERIVIQIIVLAISTPVCLYLVWASQ